MEKKIDYGSASIDVTMKVANNFKLHKYIEHTEEEKIDLLESSLVDYSISKLNDWCININPDKFRHLQDVLDVMDKVMPNDTTVTDSYFNQYVHCILYILGKIRQQEQIELLEIELDHDVAIFIENDTSTIKAIAINENTKKYKIPATIINTYREKYFNKEKTLVK